MGEQQVTGGNPGGDHYLDAVLGGSQQGAERLVERRIGDRSCAGIDDVLDVVQQHHRPAAGKCLQQRKHQPRRCLLRVPVALPQPLGDIVRQQPAQVVEQIRKVHWMRTNRAEVDDPVHHELPEVVGQPAHLQCLEQPAHQRGLAHPAPAHHRRHPQPGNAQVVRDQGSLPLPVLEIRGSGHRRRVDEPRPGGGGHWPLGLTFALQPGLDALGCLLLRSGGIVDEVLLCRDPPVQLRDLPLDQGPPTGGGTGKFPAGIGQVDAKLLEHSGGGAGPRQVVAELRQSSVDVAAEVDQLAGLEPKRQLRIGGQEQRDHRLLVLQRAHPLLLAARLWADAVGGHHEQQPAAGP